MKVGGDFWNARIRASRYHLVSERSVDETWEQLQLLARPREWLFGRWQIGRNRDIWVRFDRPRLTMRSGYQANNRFQPELACDVVGANEGTSIICRYGLMGLSGWLGLATVLVPLVMFLIIAVSGLMEGDYLDAAIFAAIVFASMLATLATVRIARDRTPSDVAILLHHIIDVTSARPADDTTRRLLLSRLALDIVGDNGSPARPGPKEKR